MRVYLIRFFFRYTFRAPYEVTNRFSIASVEYSLSIRQHLKKSFPVL